MVESQVGTESLHLSTENRNLNAESHSGEKTPRIRGVSRIFSPGLYLEGLLQLRAFTVISLILLFGNAIVFAVGELIGYNEFLEYREAGDTYVVSMYYHEYQVMGLVSMAFLVPIMTLVLFSFLNRRDCSDFYHSLPHTRLSLALSLLSAIITNIVVVLVAGWGFSVLLFRAMPYTAEFNLQRNLTVMFNVISTSIFIMAIVWLAMTLTGTIFTNLATSALILIVPMLILLITGYNIQELAPFIPASGLPGILTGAHNLLTGFIGYLWFGSVDFDAVVDSCSTGLWTLVEAGLLIALGCIFFRFRKSEAAESAAIHPVVQSILRIGVGFLISMLATQAVLNNLVNGYGFSQDEILTYVVIYFLALLAYYVYELVSTRRARNLLHIWKGALLLVVLNIAWAGAEYGISTVMLNVSPSADQIRAVEITSTDLYDVFYSYDYSYSEDAYWSSKASGVEFTSEGARTVVAEALAHTIELWKEYQKDSQYYWINYEDNLEESYFYMPVRMTFTIYTATGSIIREVRMSGEQFEAFCGYLAEDETEFVDAYLEVPDYSELESLESARMLAELSLTDEQWEDVYNCWREELKTVDFQDFFYLTFTDVSSSEFLLEAYIRGDNHSSTYALFPVTEDFTNTLDLISAYAGVDIRDYMT
ncbi:MAG: hypothetical protein LUE29_04560 [Lachnospiraceae bacterium]|nr:hypothetical protein [Lachnospiraceae bacterium]